MNKLTKRILSLILASIMLFSLIPPMTVSAASEIILFEYNSTGKTNKAGLSTGKSITIKGNNKSGTINFSGAQLQFSDGAQYKKAAYKISGSAMSIEGEVDKEDKRYISARVTYSDNHNGDLKYIKIDSLTGLEKKSSSNQLDKNSKTYFKSADYTPPKKNASVIDPKNYAASVVGATANKKAIKNTVSSKKSASVSTSKKINVKTVTGTTISLAAGVKLAITAISADGNSGYTVYNGQGCWVNLNYIKYIGPTITKPTAPTVSLSTGTDLALGELMTINWNTPTDAKYYSAIFKNSAGAVVKRYDNIYGQNASFQPTEPGTYTAEVIAYNSVYSSDPGALGKSVTVHNFSTVTFLDEDGTLLGTQQVGYGANAVAPIAPDKVGYTFQSWSDSLNNIKEDKTLTAQYNKTKYTVQFIGDKNTVLKTENVEYGDSATPPTDTQTPPNYTFVGWSSNDYENVYTVEKNEPIKIYAVYAWENVNLPISCDLLSAVRQQDGYKLTYSLENYPNNITRGRVIVALKTAEGKLVDMTESSAFSLEKGGVENNLNIFIPCEKAATTAEIYVVNGYTNNDMSDGIPISNTDSTTIVEGRMWSDWQTDPIADNGNNEIQSRTEYRFRDRRPGTSSTKTKEGYEPVMENGVIKRDATPGSWSAWQDNVIYAFENDSQKREVRTQLANVYSSRNIYPYYHLYKAGAGNHTWEAYDHLNRGGYTKHSVTATYCYERNGSSDCTGWWRYKGAACPICGKATIWFGEDVYAESYVSGTKTQYSYLDTNYTYHFFRWDDSDWSKWSADEVTATDARQVETRTVYREKSVAAGIEDTSGVSRTFSGNVGSQFAGRNITFFVSKYNALSDFTDEYVAQGIVASDGSYTFNYKLREEPSTETGDFTIAIGLEGTTEKQIVGKIEAPKPIYTVQFLDADGNIINEQSVVQGESAVLPAENPTKEGYTFVCWNNSCTNVQGDLTISSDSAVAPVFTENVYDVVYIDWRAQTFETRQYKYGEPLLAPSFDDTDSGYASGWDMALDGTETVTSNMVVTAVYDTKTFNVTYYDYDGTVIDSQTVEYDGVSEAPELPEETTADGVEYYDWEIDEEDLYGVKEDIAVFPAYTFEENAAAPTASVETGVYDNAISVSLSSTDENAVIYYTTDGSDPLESDTAEIYNDWIPIDDLPLGAVAVDQKWTYKLWGDWSDWSDWSRESVSEYNFDYAQRQVRTRSTFGYYTYQYSRYVSADGKTYSPVQNSICTRYESTPYLPNVLQYAGTSSVNGAAMYRGYSSGYWYNQTSFANSVPEFSYRDRIAEDTVSKTKVTASENITNVERLVKCADRPVEITDTSTLRFYASSFGKNDSEIQEETYVIKNGSSSEKLYRFTSEFGEDTFVIDDNDENKQSIIDSYTQVEGYTFEGYFTDEALTQQAADSEFNKDFIKLYLKYTPSVYTVTFVDEDDTVIDIQEVEYMNEATAPEVADKGTRKFIGWDTVEYEAVPSDITVKAMYKEAYEIIGINFDRASYQMNVGDTYQVNAQITVPINTYDSLNDAVIWYSSDDSIVTVDNTGLVTAVGEGTASIYATGVDEIITAELKVTTTKSINSYLVLNSLSKLDIDSEGYLRRIPFENNTVENISAQFMNGANTLLFTDYAGDRLISIDKVGTGAVISLMDGNTVLDSITVVMTGDITRDGVINNRDVALAQRVYLNKQTADAPQLRAFDVNGDGRANNRDVAMMARYLVGKEAIS